MAEHIERVGGGKVLVDTPMQEILVDENGRVEGVKLRNGEIVTADHSSAMPVDALKLKLPEKCAMPFFKQLDELEAFRHNVHLWFDRKLRPYNGLVFSRSPLQRLRRRVRACADRRMRIAPCLSSCSHPAI